MHNRTQVPKPRIPAIVPCSSSTYNWDLASTREHGLTHLHQKQQMYRQTSCSVVWLWPSGLSRPQGWLRLTEPKFKVEGSGMVWSGGRRWKRWQHIESSANAHALGDDLVLHLEDFQGELFKKRPPDHYLAAVLSVYGPSLFIYSPARLNMPVTPQQNLDKHRRVGALWAYLRKLESWKNAACDAKKWILKM
jgi:hypothetical protein